ncbi:DUF2061 domain-containing protein [Paracoccus sp. 1_MG-2023]|uniref:DUF2061 domain-containing protein n=1 Tax=unclassified Paracoccus (in: a-proteobacteria) TaxID=2688777 RepID=UPI001C08F2E4|nr:MULTISPECIES: DUF2061 domain-containing protein [unclassified Paracoccus (in: a-proteobacteria)]MBU2957822.1 DUF2061 domain-containing protein [Paracoccus sp. C2R09]MDO6667330.1 DUF2061 domain-containing protein [Paracoccus sp. 1_MG-2023]
METRRRIALKAVTWQIMGFVVMTAIGFAFTGSVRAGGGIAVVGAVTGFLCYFGHELAWSRIGWGRRSQ